MALAKRQSTTQFGEARPIPRPAPPAEASRRLGRLQRLAWILDRSIPVGRWRIGLDPIIGIIPGAGDWIGAMLSLYVLYEGARLGVPARVLTRMGGNILVETILGAIPFLGDLFDFVWQANTRNLALIEAHYRPALPPRSLRRIGLAVGGFAMVILGLIGVLVYFVLKALAGLFN